MPHISHNGARLFYEVSGETGDPIVFIQGIGVAGGAWQPQIDDLRRTHRTMQFDNRGYGQSIWDDTRGLSIDQMVDDTLALIDNAGWDACHIVGHSMGGVIAQRFALSHPKRVKSLALLCTVARGADAVRVAPKVFWIGLRTRLGPAAARRNAFLELIYPDAHLAAVDRPALAAALAPLFGRDLAANPAIMMRQAMALRAHDCTSQLASLKGVKTLVLSAEFDPIAPPRFGRKLAAAIPGAEFVEIVGASHGVPIHCAAAVNTHLRKLFAAV